MEQEKHAILWANSDIEAGTEWSQEINNHLNSADIILLLISSDFLSSDLYSNGQVQQAMQQHENGKSRVIPIILRPVDWSRTIFAKLYALPNNKKPVTMWQNQDEAFYDIVKAIRQIITETGRTSKRKEINLIADIPIIE